MLEAENAKSRKSKKPKVKRQALSVPIELKNLSDTTALEEPSPDKIVVYLNCNGTNVLRSAQYVTRISDAVTWPRIRISQHMKFATTASHNILQQKSAAEQRKSYVLCRSVPRTSLMMISSDKLRKRKKTSSLRMSKTCYETESSYDERIFREAAKKDPNFRWCANPKCGAANIVDGKMS